MRFNATDRVPLATSGRFVSASRAASFRAPLSPIRISPGQRPCPIITVATAELNDLHRTVEV